MVTLFSSEEFLLAISRRCSAAKADSCCLISWFKPWNRNKAAAVDKANSSHLRMDTSNRTRTAHLEAAAIAMELTAHLSFWTIMLVIGQLKDMSDNQYHQVSCS